MLRQLRIENFKAIRGPVEIDFGELTFLYGPNSAGKSSVLDALDLLVSIGTGNLPDLNRITSLTHDRAEQRGIALAVKVFIDAIELDHIGTTRFTELEHVLSLLAEGAWVDLQIQFGRGYEPYLVESLSISIDGERLVSYSRETASYGPYFKTGLERNPECESVDPRLKLIGRWAINLNHDAATGLCVSANRGCARAKLAFEPQTEAQSIVRGLTAYSLRPEGAIVSLDQESLELVFPTDVDKLVATPETRSLLYEWNLFDSAKGASFYNHRNYLKQYSLDVQEADVVRYMTFLRSEFADANSAALFSNLRAQATKLNQLLVAIAFVVAQSARVARVPGNRNNIDSNTPLHLKSKMRDHFDMEGWCERAVFVGESLSEPGSYSTKYDGPRSLSSSSGASDTRVLDLLAPYARRWVNHLRYGSDLEDVEDFPNYCFKHYLYSLNKYRTVPEIYLVHSDEYEETDDDTDLTGSTLVYFVLRDREGFRRTFYDVGSGVGYVLPVLAALGEFDQVAIEQPELHLHPVAQSQLADTFVHAAKGRNGGVRRVIIESHSEVFLLKISQHIREAHETREGGAENVQSLAPKLWINSESVLVYYFLPKPDVGTEVVSIRFAPDGSLIDVWPDGMFPKDWTSGLDRMRLFSAEFDLSEASKAWPWIDRLDDGDIRKWLAQGWFLEKLGETGLESATVVWGKIVERALSCALLVPLKDHGEGACYGDVTLGQDLITFMERGRPPGLGWWKSVLISLKREFGPQSSFIRCLREYIVGQTWSEAWSKSLRGSLIAFLDALIESRNPAAHSGHANRDAVIRARALIVQDGRPGMIFISLGLLSLEFRRIGGG